MELRLLGYRVQAPLLAMWTAESVAAMLATRIAASFSSSLRPYPVVSWTLSAAFAASVAVGMLSMGLLNRRQRFRSGELLLRVTIAVVIGAGLATMLFSTWLEERPPILVMLTAATLSVFLIWSLRAIGLIVIDESQFKRRVLVYGSGRNATKLMKLRRRSDQRAYQLVGFVQPPGDDSVVDQSRLLKPEASLLDTARKYRIDEIVVAMDDRRSHFPILQLLDCRIAGLEVNELITFLERETGKIHLDLLYPSWLIFGRGHRRNIITALLDRVFALSSSVGILLFALPAMLLIALAIKVEDGWAAPVLYRQVRVGYAGRLFHVLKFRSMRVDAEKTGAQWASVKDSRVTRIGRLIRKTRLDELPQVINVFRGEMSFVGPRPERPEFVELLVSNIPFYQQRHSVKPGITGWAQLCYAYGSSEADAREKLQYDLFYVKHHSLFFDVVILMQTAEVVLFGRGAR